MDRAASQGSSTDCYSQINSTVQYFGDEVLTSALASEPRAHEGAHRAYYLTYPSLSGHVWRRSRSPLSQP